LGLSIGGSAEKSFLYGLFIITVNLFCGEQHLTNKKQPEKPFDAGEYFNSMQHSETMDGIGSFWPWNRKADPLAPIVRDQATERAHWLKHIDPIVIKHDLKNDSGDSFEYHFFEKQVNEKDVFEMLRRTIWLCRDIRFPKTGVSTDVTNDFFGGADDFFSKLFAACGILIKGNRYLLKKMEAKLIFEIHFEIFL
jgi:hypothetical protein